MCVGDVCAMNFLNSVHDGPYTYVYVGVCVCVCQAWLMYVHDGFVTLYRKKKVERDALTGCIASHMLHDYIIC